jgi:hypothetical protein
MNVQLDFEKFVKESKSIIEAILRMGYDTPSNFYRMFHKYQKLYNTDISHFMTRSEMMIGNSIKTKYSLEEILVDNFIGSIGGNDLKKKLYESNLKVPCCELCGQDENWITGKISMIIDHINGNNKDNRLENLRIICPNCDAALPTFKGKNKRKKRNTENILKEKEQTYISLKEINSNRENILYKIDNFNKNKTWKSKLSKELGWSISKLNKFLTEYRPTLIDINNRNSKEKTLELINIIENNLEKINFEEKGWTIQVNNLINKTPQYSYKFIKKYFPLIFEKCWKKIK